jgi:hypothetical protein
MHPARLAFLARTSLVRLTDNLFQLLGILPVSALRPKLRVFADVMACQEGGRAPEIVLLVMLNTCSFLQLAHCGGNVPLNRFWSNIACLRFLRRSQRLGRDPVKLLKDKSRTCTEHSKEQNIVVSGQMRYWTGA